MHTKISI